MFNDDITVCNCTAQCIASYLRVKFQVVRLCTSLTGLSDRDYEQYISLSKVHELPLSVKGRMYVSHYFILKTNSKQAGRFKSIHTNMMTDSHQVLSLSVTFCFIFIM